jgi:undecaprenyl diphosphate synthase
MDGNNRWSKQNSISKFIAYNQGKKTAEKIVQFAQAIGIQYITLFAFSMENWSRPKDDVELLLEILRQTMIEYLDNIDQFKFKVRFIGERNILPNNLQDLMAQIEKKSNHFNQHIITIAISYSGRNEILHAITNIEYDDNIEKQFLNNLNPDNIPDPDLLIRTSGEQRISNFMLWQLAYTELYFTDTLWPDFSKKDFIRALKNYSLRNRRYGK